MKRIIFIAFVLLMASAIQAQISLGIVAGVNICDEVTKFNLSPNSSSKDMSSLKGVVVGPTIELMIPKIDVGLEIGTFYSRKGSNFSYELINTNYAFLLEGYKNFDYLEMPVTIKWKFGPRDFKIFVAGGYYWAYAFSGLVGVEKAENLLNLNQSEPSLIKTTDMVFGDDSANKYNLIDRGLTCGVGIQIIKTLQISLNYSYAGKSHVNEKSIKDLVPEDLYPYSETDYGISSRHNTFSIRLSYIFNGN